MPDINAKVQTISSDQLDAIFGEPSATPSADALIVGSQTEEKTVTIGGSDIPVIDMDKLEAPIEKVDDNKTEGDNTVEPPVDATDTTQNTDADTTDSTTDDSTSINTTLKTTVDYLIEKGIWKDWEGREELEIDDDLYAQIAAKQDEIRLEERFNELVDSTGDYGKAIINHIQNGGNPDDIIDIFKEQKQIESIDINDENSQTSLIQKFYSEEIGWSKAKIDKYINSLKAEDDGLESEAKDIQEKYKEVYKKQLADINEQEQNRKAEAAKKQQEYIQTLTTTIDTFENFSDRDKKLIKDSILKFDTTLENGTKINKFYQKFYEIQNDPKKYVELIHFVVDNEGYKEKINKKAETKATDKTWNFVKGNNAITKKGAQIPQKDTNKTSKIDFSSLFKK